MSCIESIVANHLKMFFRYMLDESPNEIKNRDCFCNEFSVFVSVVVKGDIISIIVINTRSGDYWSTKISPDIFNNGVRTTFIWLCINIESIF